jgi:hypothetical protein
MQARGLGKFCIVVLMAFSSLSSVAAQDARSTVLDVPLADGTAQRVLYLAPPHPRGVMVLLPGGSGEIGIERDGQIRHDDNFVIRSRQLWLQAGYAVAILDAPAKVSLRGSRSTPEYAELLSSVMAALRQHSTAPQWLLGTSQGAIGAMNGAAHASRGSLAGVILSEPVSVLGGSHETVFDADPGRVRVPALVVVNQADRCQVAPPSAAPSIVAAMRKSPSAQILSVDGGRQGDDPCGSLTAHGYYGIEDQVVSRIRAWMDQVGNATPPMEHHHRRD